MKAALTSLFILASCSLVETRDDTSVEPTAAPTRRSPPPTLGQERRTPTQSRRRACSGAPNWKPQWTEAEKRVVVLVNKYRRRGAFCGARRFGPATPLRMEGRLQCAARAHSRDMVRRRFFDHTNTRGESPFDRISKVGYPPGAQAENISAGRPSPEAVVAGWMDSPGHCRNIMDPGFREIGVGYFPSADMMGHYWTQTFGRR